MINKTFPKTNIRRFQWTWSIHQKFCRKSLAYLHKQRKTEETFKRKILPVAISYIVRKRLEATLNIVSKQTKELGIWLARKKVHILCIMTQSLRNYTSSIFMRNRKNYGKHKNVKMFVIMTFSKNKMHQKK